MSKIGKNDLLRIVAPTMPNYLISLFLLPLDICKDLEILMNSFFMNYGNSG